jgi:hypothetical protein
MATNVAKKKKKPVREWTLEDYIAARRADQLKLRRERASEQRAFSQLLRERQALQAEKAQLKEENERLQWDLRKSQKQLECEEQKRLQLEGLQEEMLQTAAGACEVAAQKQLHTVMSKIQKLALIGRVECLVQTRIAEGVKKTLEEKGFRVRYTDVLDMRWEDRKTHPEEKPVHCSYTIITWG